MTLAGIELRFLVNNLTQQTKDYYVSNIYGISRENILFKLHHPEKPDILLMISTMGLWVTSVKIEKIEQNRLIKRLRSNLLRMKLTKVEQLDAERIAYLTFSGFDKEYVLVGEFFSGGNILLCDKDKKILALLHSIDVRHRQLKVGLQYTPPPQNGLNVFEITKEDLNEIKNSSIECARWIGRTLGLPSKYVEEICRDSKVDSKTIGNTLTDDEISRIYKSVIKIIKLVVEGPHDPTLVKNEKKSDVYPIKLGKENGNYTPVPSFIEGLDILFTESIVEKGKSLQSDDSDKKTAELQKILDEQTKAIILVKEKSNVISTVAKELLGLISLGVTSIEDAKVTQILQKNNSKLFMEKGISIIQIHDEKIKINLKASIQSIASRLFDESKRQFAAIKSIIKLKEKTEKNLEKQKSEAKVAKETITVSEVRKKNWFERYRWFFTSDGLLAIGGRDVSSNSSVIRKHMDKDDKIFHADIFGSPFFILKNCADAPMASLQEVAYATVCFSRAWREAMYGMNAYWVNPDQVKKAAPSGQFLPKGSFIIDGQRNFVKISTLKLAIGILKHDENFIVSCGPPDPIKKTSICYAIIEPADMEISAVAKKIKLEFMKMKEEIVKPISIDEFVRCLPAGTSHITDVGFGDASDE